jgi:hypothetical protein
MTSDISRLGTRFDVREFARTARGNHRADLQLADYPHAPLGIDALRMVRFLGRLESATMEHLRNLLVTATHKDARVTAFLVTWAFEKFWIADALDAVLEANGQPRIHAEDEGAPRRSRSEASDRRGPIRRAISAIGKGVPIVGVHMATGLVDEWVTRFAYERLDAAAGSSSLSSTISMILDVKRRHADFFEDETVRRFTESARDVRQGRSVITHSTFPIGAVDRAADDRTFFERYVFADAIGTDAARRIGAQVSGLPGFDESIGAAVTRRLAA